MLSKQGNYQQAEAMYRQVLEGYKKVLGRKHPHTLISIDILCAFLDNWESVNSK